MGRIHLHGLSGLAEGEARKILDDPDLKWIADNQAAIVKAWGARPMTRVRPTLAWPDGKVRVEFVGTFPSASSARACFEKRMIESAETTEPAGGS